MQFLSFGLDPSILTVNMCFGRSAYENQVYCDTFHAEETGWRECSLCNKVFSFYLNAVNFP